MSVILKSNGGFTLVEIITTIALLAGLTVVGIALFNNMQYEMRNALARHDASMVARQFNTANALTFNGLPAINGTSLNIGHFSPDAQANLLLIYLQGGNQNTQSTLESLCTVQFPSSYGFMITNTVMSLTLPMISESTGDTIFNLLYFDYSNSLWVIN